MGIGISAAALRLACSLPAQTIFVAREYSGVFRSLQKLSGRPNSRASRRAHLQRFRSEARRAPRCSNRRAPKPGRRPLSGFLVDRHAYPSPRAGAPSHRRPLSGDGFMEVKRSEASHGIKPLALSGRREKARVNIPHIWRQPADRPIDGRRAPRCASRQAPKPGRRSLLGFLVDRHAYPSPRTGAPSHRRLLSGNGFMEVKRSEASHVIKPLALSGRTAREYPAYLPATSGTVPSTAGERRRFYGSKSAARAWPTNSTRADSVSAQKPPTPTRRRYGPLAWTTRQPPRQKGLVGPA